MGPARCDMRTIGLWPIGRANFDMIRKTGIGDDSQGLPKSGKRTFEAAAEPVRGGIWNASRVYIARSRKIFQKTLDSDAAS